MLVAIVEKIIDFICLCLLCALLYVAGFELWNYVIL